MRRGQQRRWWRAAATAPMSAARAASEMLARPDPGASERGELRKCRGGLPRPRRQRARRDQWVRRQPGAKYNTNQIWFVLDLGWRCPEPAGSSIRWPRSGLGGAARHWASIRWPSPFLFPSCLPFPVHPNRVRNLFNGARERNEEPATAGAAAGRGARVLLIYTYLHLFTYLK